MCYQFQHNLMDLNGEDGNEAQDATQRNATQRNATQRNATQHGGRFDRKLSY